MHLGMESKINSGNKLEVRSDNKLSDSLFITKYRNGLQKKSVFIFPKQLTMPNFKFDGINLHSSSGSTIARVDGANIKNSSGSTVGRIDGLNIRDSHGSVVCRVDGINIRNASGSTIAKTADISKVIQGAGAGPTSVALWWFFCR